MIIFYLLQCFEVCPRDKWGLNCENECSCQNGAACLPNNGTCMCKPGWEGEQCEKRACPDGRWGKNCQKVLINSTING